MSRKKFKPRQINDGPTQRMLRVGEEVRHALAKILSHREFRGAVELDVPVTITEVRMTGDLKNAIAFFIPLSGADKGKSIGEIMQTLEDLAPSIQHALSREVDLRFLPKIKFRPDTSFDEMHKINTLLHSPAVEKDLKKGD